MIDEDDNPVTCSKWEHRPIQIVRPVAEAPPILAKVLHDGGPLSGQPIEREPCRIGEDNCPRVPGRQCPRMYCALVQP